MLAGEWDGLCSSVSEWPVPYHYLRSVLSRVRYFFVSAMVNKAQDGDRYN